jgi:transcriptional regulator with XRE-family HTH domain
MQTKLGQLLKEERLKLKMSQREFANFLGMLHSTYERVENGRNDDLKLDCVIKILTKINIPLELFIPSEVLSRYFIQIQPKTDEDVKNILMREVSKFVKKVEYKFARASKPKK